MNTILNQVEPEVLEELATGIIGEIAQSMGTVGRLLTIWSVEAARDTAWTNTELLWALQSLPEEREDLLVVLDRMTGLASRGLLMA